jgi:hypothetical protein
MNVSQGNVLLFSVSSSHTYTQHLVFQFTIIFVIVVVAVLVFPLAEEKPNNVAEIDKLLTILLFHN